MGYSIIVAVIYCLPFIWALWSGIDVRNGKREHTNWKGPLLLFVVTAVVSVVVNSYLTFSYNLSFFLNSSSVVTVLITVGILGGLMGIINIITTMIARRKNWPKTMHNPKVIWIIFGSIAGSLLIFLLWFMPIGQKISYVVTLNNAVSAMEASTENDDISLVQVLSEADCVSRRCAPNYNNVFYVRNNLDQPKEVQVKIRALNNNEEEVKVIDSEIVELDPDDMKMVTTEETIKSGNIWEQYSFKTEERVAYYQYNFRHRDLE
ncbi:hypothetical protein KFZ56_04505 [Virgibacillus sp. NKC19-3]|uniref:hypothetical protein n=1 Tax=Virgibacillus saliphilus TaxID=2831674 RepID=UPI001C9B51E5|nr:hypothetical protein [Virgibacillus sp. NKC19-3]MBY7142366.1 hypothetical protein [Virgibacillus sp. NKC19-3]